MVQYRTLGLDTSDSLGPGQHFRGEYAGSYGRCSPLLYLVLPQVARVQFGARAAP